MIVLYQFCAELDDDLTEVIDAMQSIAAHWRKLALRLHLKDDAMEVIQANYPRDTERCLIEAIKEWLRKNYSFTKHGRPSWQKLVMAAYKVDKALALTIAKEHRGNY